MSRERKNNSKQYSFQCPVCKKGKISIKKTIYDLPDSDKMLIIKFECDNCNYSNNDIIPLTTNFAPGIIVLNITNEQDLNSKIYRSPIAKLEIPELELAVEPGPNANFYYTNVEGILLRFEDAVRIYKKNLEKNDSQLNEIDELLKNIQKALKGDFNFTIKISDTGGGSYIIPHDKSKYSFRPMENLEHP